jgi:hypothetical protein
VNPLRRSDGSSTAACATMPSVVPTPRTSSFASPIRTGSRLMVPGIAAYRPSVAITTMLLSTGAQAGGPNTPRVFRIAANSAPMP